jgi:hypothetical protein
VGSGQWAVVSGEKKIIPVPAKNTFEILEIKTTLKDYSSVIDGN